MKIPQEIRNKYLIKADPEASFFLDYFDEDNNNYPDSLKVLEVGANDNDLGFMLGERGFWVWGIDLMNHKENDFIGGGHYRHTVGDFCELASTKEKQIDRKYDIIYSISALEHFGLGTYTKEKYQPFYDVVAARYIYDLLKPGGVAYISVPYGGRMVELNPHWRVYDWPGLKGRIIQDFDVEFAQLRVVELNGYTDPVTKQQVKCGDWPTREMTEHLMNGEPYISVLLKLRKNAK